MQIEQNQLIIDYIKQLQCPIHNMPIKFMSYSPNVQNNQKLICSECAETCGLNNYKEVECCVKEINKDKLPQPIRNACQKHLEFFDGFKNQVVTLINQPPYFLESTQNRKGLSEFKRELEQYHRNNKNSNNAQQLVENGKKIINNSIRQLETLSNDLTSLLTNSQYEQQNLTEIWRKIYQNSILLEADFSDQEFFILIDRQQLELYNIKIDGIKLQQKYQLKEKVNCMIKAQSKPLFFLGKQNGIVEVFEQLTNGNYVSSHQIEAHLPGKYQYGVSCIITNSDSSEIITGGYDALVKSWRFRNRQWNLISTLNQHRQIINSLSYNSDFSIFGSASQDQTFSLYTSNPQNLYANKLTQTKQKRVNTICFVSPTNFFISLNQDNKIYLYSIQKTEGQIFQIQQLYDLPLNEMNTELTVEVQPRYYQQLQLLIFQNNYRTYFLCQDNQNKFQTIPISRYISRSQQQNNATQPENSLQGIVSRIIGYGELSIQLFKEGPSYVIRASKFQ
ncbi:unnamed protein product [Paramecium octaurelia]|uniref:WD domain, G-beta repeat protein n=1 Tax=Paramecium octaurelia TaxID=43137 RepID=A0A8S1UE32_PAROT|nr:unnamed protein product [Paramecium octaurelia]